MLRSVVGAHIHWVTVLPHPGPNIQQYYYKIEKAVANIFWNNFLKYLLDYNKSNLFAVWINVD